ncbi:hypothetical protein AXG93_4530s1050 [Marchantia polymorpha subsp. ruderalis]|uniref:Uncharacterized protein n=1 Tax=Marchantia polymorpha subsp. ruderalis TaxID=1480154 RepID=A0A176VVF8_MARPO|nr:hypothetical protein AXG93_4530s1050 [Marchantia polymorpha subsp. ruderalis]
MRVLSPAVRERSKKAEIKAQLKRERLEERSLRGRRKHAAQSHPDSTHRLSQGFGRMKVAIGFVVLCLATYFFSMAYADSESVPLVSEAGHTLVPGLETPPRTSLSISHNATGKGPYYWKKLYLNAQELQTLTECEIPIQVDWLTLLDISGRGAKKGLGFLAREQTKLKVQHL